MRKPFFKQSRNCWYVHHQGKQVNLGRDREAGSPGGWKCRPRATNAKRRRWC